MSSLLVCILTPWWAVRPARPHLMQALEATAGEMRGIIGGVDVPFLERMA